MADRVPLYQKVADLALRNFADRTIAISRSVARFVHECRYIPNKQISVVYNGVPAAAADVITEAEKKELKSALGVTAESPVVTILGRLHRSKGQDTFIRAARLIKEQKPNAVFLIVGDGPDELPLKKLSDSLGLGDSVRFLGYREDTAELLSISNVQVSCSTAEGLSLAIIEGMAQQVPQIGTDVGGIPELISNEESGLLVGVGDSDAIAQGVFRMIENADFVQAVTDRALDRVHRTFSIEENVKGMIEIYKNVLRSGSASEPEPLPDGVGKSRL